MQIRLITYLGRTKVSDHASIMTQAENNSRPLIEKLKKAGKKIARPLLSLHSDWQLEVKESGWDYEFDHDVWRCYFDICLTIVESSSGEAIDEFATWYLLGKPLYEAIPEPLYIYDWSSLRHKEDEGFSLRFSSLRVVHNNEKDGLYFYYESLH